MSIIVSRNNKNAQRLNKQEFGLEQDIQQYIYDNPDTIPIYEIDSDIRLFVVAREFQTNSGPIDALAFDQNGNIYVVETKLFRNPDKRTVVAQALDYGASLWRHSTNFEAFIEQLNRHTNKQFNKNFKEAFADFFSMEDISEMLVSISDNLNSGNIKFVVLMDKLHNRLKDLIVYINQNSHFDIYAVEVEYYKHDDFEIIIPKLYGAEVKKEVISTNKSRVSYSYSKTDKEGFLASIREHRNSLSEYAFSVFPELLDIYEQLADFYGASLVYSKSEKAGQVHATLQTINDKKATSLYSTGVIWTYNLHSEEDGLAQYIKRVLNRLIDEKLFDKTEKNLTISSWGIMLTHSKKNPDIDRQIARLLEILKEEIK